MIQPDKISGTYWDLLQTAEKLLNNGNFPAAELHYDSACSRREESPGRVFVTEKISDGLGRLFRKQSPDAPPTPGRWERNLGKFRQRFLAEGDAIVRKAVHLAELRPEDNAEVNQPILEQGLYLVGRSRLFSEEPASAVPMLKGVFRTAKRTGRPFPVDLIRHDLPLTEEDRLWLARRGGELVEEFQEQGVLVAGTQEAEEWARICLQLLNPRYFGQTGRLEEERCWVEAMTADHLLGRAAESVEAYRKYLAEYPAPGPRADEARLRLLELLANIDGLHFQVPNYDEALAAMQSAGLSPDSAMAGRFEAALARIEYRCPDPDPDPSQNSVWASLALEDDGRIAAVLWWRNQPRDLAYWRPGEDPGPIQTFLESCDGRLIVGNQVALAILERSWEDFSGTWCVRDFVAVLLEVSLPTSGLDPEALLRIGMGETAAWRSSWHPDHGHVHLEPPKRSTLVDSWQGGPAGASLATGLLLLAMQSRLATADPCLRAGIRHLAKRGDPASSFIYEFLTVGSEASSAVDSSFEPWTLPLLWTRPDPFGWTSQGSARADSAFPAADALARPDLGRNDLAIVSTGDPAAVVAAWGNGRQKWRIVLDRLDRLDSLSRVAGGAIGPVTLIPRSGKVHDLDAALELLEQMLDPENRPLGAVDGLLPIFHWMRLVETHNGDLLDFQDIRPRATEDIPLYGQYQDLVQKLSCEEPRLVGDRPKESWASQFSQRVRKAGFVAGMVDSLVADPSRLDSLWGVFEGSDASWVFLDSAAIHWSLLSRETSGIQELHSLLHSRGHRHLSLLTGAIWLRSELEELLGTWLGVFGNPYCVGLTDGRPPRLRLADRGWVPDSRNDPISALSGQLAHVRNFLSEDNSGTVLLPTEGLAGQFWRDVSCGDLPLAGKNWAFLPAASHGPAENFTEADYFSGRQQTASQSLLVPVLASLEGGVPPIALEDSHAAWAVADRSRDSFLEWRRKLCGLEIASLMAGTWQKVEIMDPRWWRLLRPEPVPEAGESHSSRSLPWSGAHASALVSTNGCTTFNLPDLGLQGDEHLPTQLRESVARWYAALPTEGPRNEDPSARKAELPALQGKASLLLGDPAQHWAELVRKIGCQWERGDLASWILLVSDQMPGPAADLVASSWVPGISTWHARGGHALPGPILWVRKEHFSQPVFVEFLGKHRPTLIMACEVQDWLPGPNNGQQVGAHALRTLVASKASLLVMQARNLAQPWGTFLAEATGSVLVGNYKQPDDSPDYAQQMVFPGQPESLPLLRHLLNRLELVLPVREGDVDQSRQSLVSARQLVSLRWLACLAGVSEADIAQGVRVLRWAGRLNGDLLTAASGQLDQASKGPGTHALLIPLRFAELEHLLQGMENQLPILFPLLLGSHRPGLSTWIDLAFPPVEIAAEDLLRLDCFFSMVAGDTVPALGYDAPKGLMNSTQRVLVCQGNPADVLQDLQEVLGLFRSRVKDVMAGALETGEGFLVETGLNDVQKDERSFLALGAAMGLWRWLGPADNLDFHLVDLLTLAESPTVMIEESGWRLLSELASEKSTSGPKMIQTGARNVALGETSSGWHLGGLKSLLQGGGRNEDFNQSVQRLAEVITKAGTPGMLVLKGRLGSGRHEAIATALAAERTDLGVTVYCPDPEAAVVFLEAASRAGIGFALDIRIAEKGITPPAPHKFSSYLAMTPDNLIIMCEVQRFEKETRYRIAQMGRGRKLLMTIDPAANSEPWENLFLTTPRAVDIFELEQPRRQAKKLWAQVRELLPENLQGKAATLRQDKGSVQVDFAVNLDQCLARLIRDVEAGELPDRLRLTGPLLSDLDFLADSIRQQGWLAIPENSLCQLLLPGVREVLAVATDLLTRKIAIAQEVDLDSDSGAVPTFLTPSLLASESQEDWRKWHDSCEWDLSTMTMADFFAQIEDQIWARSFLSHPAATGRMLALLQDWGEESVSVLAITPLWEAWWLTTLSQSGLKLPQQRRPLVTLAEAGSSTGLFAPGGVYLCLGSEEWRQHYGVLARVTDQALILFKDRSPFAGDLMPPAR